MADIYQQIWNADQAHNGIEPILENDQGDEARGYVRVSAALDTINDPSLRVLKEVVLPAGKKDTYDLCRRLFNNYALPERAREVETPEERTERHSFVEAIRDTPPMRVARSYVEERTGEPVSLERWHNTLIEMWFRQFSDGGDPDLSGFEHVVVGEQQGGKVQGYHFWYKYYLDDGFARSIDEGTTIAPPLPDDRITYVRSEARHGQGAFPESVTIQFRWDALDYEAMKLRPLYKSIGGFFVGCSVEGLMALGTVRAHIGARAPQTTVVEGARYDLKLFHSPNKLHIRTFYPMFLGAADPVNGSAAPNEAPRPVAAGKPGDIRILAALVNPAGHDAGNETVTIINAGPTRLRLEDWRIADKDGKSEPIGVLDLAPGGMHTVRLTGKGPQLANKGTTIRLERGDGEVVHSVSYTKAQARRENGTIIFQ